MSTPDAREFCDQQTLPIDTSPGTVRIMIAMDFSGSMVGSKYTSASAALTNVLANAMPNVDFGFDTYPDKHGSQSCAVDEPVIFDCGPDTEGKIASWLTGNAPISGSGDPLVLQMQRFLDPSYAPNFTDPAAAGQRYLVVVADGDDCCGPMGNYSCSNEYLDEVTDQTAKLLQAGIKTLAVGYTASADAATLNSVAAEGGTDFDTYLLATDAAALEAALSTFADAVASCAFDLAKPDEAADPDRINLYFENGYVIPYDEGCESGTGWTWTDDNQESVRLCGQSCDRVLSGSDSEILARFGCPTNVVD